MRASARLVCLLLSLACSSAAFAQACAPVDDPTKFSDWPTAELPSTGDKLGPAQQLYAVLELMRHDGATDPPSVHAKGRLSELITRVLHDFDGTAATARWLGTSDLTPQACPSRLGDDGIPVSDCAWEVFADDPVKLPFPASSANPASPVTSAASCELERRFAGYVRTTFLAVNQWQADFAKGAAHTLAQQDKEWQNLITHGYSQYPWEVLLNSAWIDDHDWGPTNNFAIFLHPAVGAGVANIADASGKSAAAVVMLSVEALGYVRYFSHHSQYLGIGATATLNNLQWDERGLGLVLHTSGFSLGMSHGLREHSSWTVFWLVDVTAAFDDGLLKDKMPKVLKEVL